MRQRLGDILLALLAVVVVTLSVLVLRDPSPPTDELATPAPASPAAASASPTQSPSPTPRPGRPVKATQGREMPVVAFAGDALVAGMGATDPAQAGYVSRIGGGFFWETKAVGLPGAGYLDAAPGPTVLDAVRRLDLPTLKPDLVVLQAGHSDVGLGTADAIEAAVVAAVQAVEKQAPDAQVVVVGVLSATRPSPAARATDAAIRAGADAAGALFTNTIDMRFTAKAPTRPDDDGFRLIAVRIASSFRDLGLVAQ